MPTDLLVEARGLVKEYAAGRRVVDDVSFSIRRGETLGLVGESGSGKSTVARRLLRLVELTAGDVRYEGRDLLNAGSRQMREMRLRPGVDLVVLCVGERSPVERDDAHRHARLVQIRAQ